VDRRRDRFDLFSAGTDAVERALEEDTLLYPSRIVEEIAERQMVELVPAIVAYLRRMLDSMPREQRELARDIDYRLHWAVDALRRLGLTDESRALFVDLLEFPSRNVKDPVLRDPPLEDAMRRVVENKCGWQESTARQWLEVLHQSAR
jgi:hypothetical protein